MRLERNGQRLCRPIAAVLVRAMPDPTASSAASFTTPERELIRREFCQHFGGYPLVAQGIFLRTWRGGPQAGEPKLPPAVRSMLERGLVELRRDGRFARAHFTTAGITTLRDFAANRRYLDPIRYAHVRRELGLEVEADKSPTSD
jgi:hypothetical protein